ncbi:MAG: Chlorite dismutase [Patescibacteria group bacterium]|nr:Chlorite dismutase [Patescibacteria group bacterium]
MDTHPYHNYLFFDLGSEFYQLSAGEQAEAKAAFSQQLDQEKRLIVTPYLTRGYKPDTTFMLWSRSQDPAHIQELLGRLLRTQLGHYLKLTHTFFGIVRPSVYSGRTGKPEQVIQNHKDRLPYFILYPFTKTHEWHQLELEKRKKVMYEHMNIGVGFPNIRQCLLYSYGLDDNEFLVSYETASLEEFQDLVIKLRPTAGRPYTLRDTPIFTCLYHSLPDLMEAL